MCVCVSICLSICLSVCLCVVLLHITYRNEYTLYLVDTNKEEVGQAVFVLYCSKLLALNRYCRFSISRFWPLNTKMAVFVNWEVIKSRAICLWQFTVLYNVLKLSKWLVFCQPGRLHSEPVTINTRTFSSQKCLSISVTAVNRQITSDSFTEWSKD